MNTPMISVIIPVYRVEKYLERCVKSVLCQSYSNIEIILVDDGSPDQCPELCDKFAENDDRIKVIHKENAGLSSARNVGLDLCSGEYIAFVDSDDYVHPQFIEVLYKAISEHEADVAVCGYSVTRDLKEKETHTISRMSSIVVSGQYAATYHVKTNSTKYLYAWNKLYKAEVFAELRYPLGKLCEDLYLMHKIFFRADKVAVTNEKLYFYYMRDGSITNAGAYFFDYYKEALDEFELYCEKYINVKSERGICILRSKARKIDVLLDDYWRAKRNKDIKKQKQCEKKYTLLYNNVVRRGRVLSERAWIYNLSPKLFLLVRDVYEITLRYFLR